MGLFSHFNGRENVFSTRAAGTEEKWADPAPLESLLISMAEEQRCSACQHLCFPLSPRASMQGGGRTALLPHYGEVCGGSVRVGMNRERPGISAKEAPGVAEEGIHTGWCAGIPWTADQSAMNTYIQLLRLPRFRKQGPPHIAA